MVDNCFSVAVFCICSAVMAVLLRQYCREQSLFVALIACVGVLSAFMVFAGSILGDVKEIFEGAGVPESYITLIFKAVAVCFITQMACGICRDSGETAIASMAEIWGRGAVTFISIPLIQALLEKIDTIISQGS